MSDATPFPSERALTCELPVSWLRPSLASRAKFLILSKIGSNQTITTYLPVKSYQPAKFENKGRIYLRKIALLILPVKNITEVTEFTPLLYISTKGRMGETFGDAMNLAQSGWERTHEGIPHRE